MRYISLILFSLLIACGNPAEDELVYQSETLKIKKIAPNTYVHITQLKVPDYGTFPCNGLIYINNGEAAIFDTPTENTISAELIDFVEKELETKVKAVVINHFHDDCLGGIREFHKRGIPSYANQATIALAQNGDFGVPQNGFDQSHVLTIGDQKVINRFIGEAHTSDNIVSYIPSTNVLFGGCMIKELGAGKGNLNDANVQEWSNTARSIKDTYPELKYIVPGHGKVGGTELLDFTIDMFRED